MNIERENLRYAFKNILAYFELIFVLYVNLA